MAQPNSSNSGTSSGIVAKLKSFVTEPMGMALTGAVGLASLAFLYVVVF